MDIRRAGNRQRLRDAYRLHFTGEVPFFECYVAEEIVDQVMGRPMGKHMLKLEAADYVQFLQRTGMDAAYLYEGWFLGRKNFVDERGRVHYVDGTIKSRVDFDKISIPSLDPVKARIETYLEAAQGTELGAIYSIDQPVGLAMTAIGMQDFLFALYEDPGFVNEFLDRTEEYTLALTECVVRYPLDAIWAGAPICAKAGPLLSPEMHAEFIFPRVEKVMSIIRPSGIPVVCHVDGDASQFMDWIVKTGYAAVHPFEPGIGNYDIYRMKQRYGNSLCVHGNIDVGSVLAHGTPETVRDDVIRHITRLAPGGGYICGSSHDISENVPFENFRALAETICGAQAAKDGSVTTVGSV